MESAPWACSEAQTHLLQIFEYLSGQNDRRSYRLSSALCHSLPRRVLSADKDFTASDWEDNLFQPPQSSRLPSVTHQGKRRFLRASLVPLSSLSLQCTGAEGDRSLLRLSAPASLLSGPGAEMPAQRLCFAAAELNGQIQCLTGLRGWGSEATLAQ